MRIFFLRVIFPKRNNVMIYTYSGMIIVASVMICSNKRWKEVEFDEFINHDVDRYPIQVKTNNDNDGGIWIKIYDDIYASQTGASHHRMTFCVNFKDFCMIITNCPGMDNLNCSPGSHLTDMPTTPEKVWTFYRNKHELNVTCNGITVWHKTFASISETCATNMNKTMVRIYFENSHGFVSPKLWSFLLLFDNGM